MSKKLTALFLALAVACAALAVHFFSSYTFVTKEPASTGEVSMTPTPTPRLNPSLAKTGRGNVTVTVYLPINLTYNNSTVTLSVYVNSSYWLINGVFYNTDWQSGYHPMYFYELAQYKNEINRTATLTDIPDGCHYITVHANVHDGSHCQNTVYFTVNTTKTK